MSVVICAMRDEDLPALQQISPPVVKPEIEFSIFPTLVAEVDGTVAGYCQFTVTPPATILTVGHSPYLVAP